ncbi:MAG: hypothetical protein IPG75_22715, partial [Gemmatimonadetes bacterium]|nr:hypothetical protein [Gemmatimonadota bacterium]
EPLRAGARNTTLLEVLDITMTPISPAAPAAWCFLPLRRPAAIDQRLDACRCW